MEPILSHQSFRYAHPRCIRCNHASYWLSTFVDTEAWFTGSVLYSHPSASGSSAVSGVTFSAFKNTAPSPMELAGSDVLTRYRSVREVAPAVCNESEKMTTKVLFARFRTIFFITMIPFVELRNVDAVHTSSGKFQAILVVILQKKLLLRWNTVRFGALGSPIQCWNLSIPVAPRNRCKSFWRLAVSQSCRSSRTKSLQQKAINGPPTEGYPRFMNRP